MEIKIGIRSNLIYPLMIIIFTFFRQLDLVAMNKYIGFSGSVLLTLIMFLSEFISGLVFFLYYNKIYSVQKKPELITKQNINNKYKLPDSNFKIYFLIFIAAYMDFTSFLVQTYYLPKFKSVSKSLDIRVRSSLTISNAILCYYLLRFKIYQHQKLSLFIILPCFIIVIISEYFFEQYLKKGDGLNYIYILLLILLKYIFNGFLDIIEKYLLEVDYINFFKMLMLEGIFGFIFTSFYSLIENPFDEVKSIYNKDNKLDILFY